MLGYLAAIVYMGTFYCLSVVVTRRSKVATNGLLIALAVWLIVVLILPQIGDTLDPDNQVPGGLFAALNLAKPQETQILAHFSFYETIRAGFTSIMAKAKRSKCFSSDDASMPVRMVS